MEGANTMKRYYDYEHDQIVHEDELRKEYEAMDKEETSASNAQEYIDNCQDYHGGMLSLITGMTDVGNIDEQNIPDTGWLNRDLAVILTQEQMYSIYIAQDDLTDQYDSFADFLASVTDVNGLFRRVI